MAGTVCLSPGPETPSGTFFLLVMWYGGTTSHCNTHHCYETPHADTQPHVCADEDNIEVQASPLQQGSSSSVGGSESPDMKAASVLMFI